MDNQPLNVKIDSGSAQADLHALARALDETGAAANRMAAGLSQGMSGADRAIKGSMANMERFAQVAAVVNKIKINSDGTKAVAEFARVMNAVARTQEIEKSKIDSWSKFIQIGAHTSRLKMDSGATAAMNSFIGVMDRAAKTRDINAGKMASWVKFIEIGARAGQLRAGGAGMVGLNAFAQAMDGASKSRAISQAKLKSWVDFIEVAARSQRLKFDPQTARSLMEFGRAMEGFKAPGKGSIDRLDKMFKVLSSAKPIPNAREVARDLDMIAASATRAAAALAQMPGGRFNVGGAGRRVAAGGAGGGGGNTGADMHAAAGGAGKATGAFNTYAGGADKASKSTYTLGERLRGLNHRFDLAYQASTLFTHAFGAFTIGGMVKGVYDASIELQKLEKAMLFTTKSYEGSKNATQQFIGTVFEMGLALDQVAEPFGRFTISSAAAGMSAKDSSDIFRSVTQTLQVVGASAEQTGYAMYGLTQMIQKGKVSSEEFNRQIGEQIPGNAEAGRRALSRLTGQAVSMQEFFKKMSLGQIESPEFTKAWAQELNTMFGGLMGLVKDRPDVALNRLKTAFTIFQQEIGKSGFIAELGVQFNRLADMFGTTENGIFKLKPKFQELAQQLGRNLANMVRAAADAVAWLAENFDKVMFAAKALATLYVAKTFISWGSAAGTAVSGIVELTSKLLGLKAAQEAVIATQVTGAAGAVAPKAAKTATATVVAADMASVISARNAAGVAPAAVRGAHNTREAFATVGQTAVNDFARPRGAQGGGAIAFGRRMPKAAGVADIAAAGATNAANTATAATASSMGRLASIGRIVGVSFGVLGIAAVATGAALTLLSDKTTKLGEAQVKFGDIFNSALKQVSDGFGSFFSSFFNRMAGGNAQEGLDNLGMVAQATVQALLWFGEMVGDTAAILVHVVGAIGKAAGADFKGAWDELKQIPKDFSDNFNFDERMAKAQASTMDAAIKRLQDERGNQESEMRTREAARLLQAQAAADDQLKAAQLQMKAAEEMTKTMEVPTMRSVTERIERIASGAFAAANPSKTAADRTADNVEAVTTLQTGTADTSAANSVRYGHVTATGKVLSGKDVGELAANIFNELQSRGTRPGMSAQESTEKNRAWSIERARLNVLHQENRMAETRRSVTQLGVNVPQQYRAGLQAAAQRNGVDASVMARLIRAESGFRSGVAGTGGDAVGLGQFTMGTWNRVMKDGPQVTSRNMGASDPRRNADLNLEATARYMAENNRALKDVLKRDANSGEQYLAHFLGTSGASKMLRAYAADPTQTARAAGIGNQDQYNKNPVFRNGNVTMSQLYQWAQGKVGGSGGGGMDGVTPSISGSAADEAKATTDKAIAQKSNDWKSLQSILALPDPASQAVARANALAEQLNDLAIRDEERIKEYGENAKLLTTEVVAQIEASKTRLFKEMSDSLNPIDKLNRQMGQTNDLVELTVRGLGKQAEWQEKMNDLKEQGYDLPLMENEARWTEHINRLNEQGLIVQASSLTTAKQQWEVERNRAKTLETQVQLMDTLNEARQRMGAASGRSTRDGYFADLVNRSSDSGTYAEKLADVQSRPDQLAAMNRIADVQALSDRAEAARNIVLEMSDELDTAATTGAARSMRATYRDVLRSLTGDTNATVSEIETRLSAMTDGSGKSIMTLAQTVATAREKIENPPGFKAWVDALEPFSRRMEGIKASFLDGLSDGLTDTLMGEEVDWGSIAKNVQKQVVKAQVDEMLKGALGMFGIKQGVTPEVEAAMTAAQAQIDAAKATVDAIEKQQRSEVDAAAQQREATQRGQDQVAQQVTALTTAADALQRIADKLDPNGAAGRIMQDAANDTREQAMALSSGNGYDADGKPIANTSLLTPARIMADADDERMAAAYTGSPTKVMADAEDERMAAAFTLATSGSTAPTTASVSMEPIATAAEAAARDGATAGIAAAVSAVANDNTVMAAAYTGSPTKVMADAEDERMAAAFTLATSGSTAPTTASVSMEPIATAAEAAARDGATAGIAAAVSAVANDNTVMAPIAAAATQAASPGVENLTMPSTIGALSPLTASVPAITSPASTGSASMLSRVFGAGNDGQSNSPLSFLGDMFGKGKDMETRGSGFMKAFGLAGMLKGLLDKPKKPDLEYKPVNGVIGERRAVDVTGEAIGPKANVIGSLLSSAVGMAAGTGFGAPGGNLTNAMGFGSKSGIAAATAARGAADYKGGAMGWLGRMFGGAFKEGGVSGSAAQTVSLSGYDWSSAPHYSEGTPNTTGGMPAILHPDEAVIPLSRGRSVPVDLSGMDLGGGGGNSVVTNVTVIAPNPDAFRKSQGSIQRQQNRDQRRAAARNLN